MYVCGVDKCFRKRVLKTPSLVLNSEKTELEPKLGVGKIWIRVWQTQFSVLECVLRVGLMNSEWELHSCKSDLKSSHAQGNIENARGTCWWPTVFNAYASFLLTFSRQSRWLFNSKSHAASTLDSITKKVIVYVVFSWLVWNHTLSMLSIKISSLWFHFKL